MASLLYVFLFVVFTGTCLSNPQLASQTGFVQNGAHQCGHASYDCVPYFQCVDGVINTDGSGLIDVRTRPQGTCTNPDYQEVPAVCCFIPGAVPIPEPIQTCPDYQECVDYSLCSADGNIITDGSGLIDIRTLHTSCFLPSGIRGRCCNPPPPYVDVCPGGSVCVQGHDCFGTALDASNIFVEYISTGLWTTCPQYVKGVCCINKPIGLVAAKECGIRNYNLDQRISSPHANNEAVFGEFPWQSIIFYANYTFNCGASLISHKHVLTAAHCVNKLLPGDIRIRFGEWQVNSFDESLPYVDRNVYAVYIHPKFNPINLHNDIAVLELIEPLNFEYHINTICQPSLNQIFDPFTPCFATGWGKDSFTGTFQHILKKIDLPYIEYQQCQNFLRKTRLGKHFKLDKSFICAGGEANKDACFGDGGGPLICKDQITQQYVQVGITAWGIGCGNKDVPGVYVNVAGFLGWVDEIVLGSNQQQTVPGYGK